MTASDNLLMTLEIATLRSTTQEQRIARRDAYDAVAWYVSTGRASAAWVRSALRADPGKLLDHVGQGTVEDDVDRATRYLRRWCGLTVEGRTRQNDGRGLTAGGMG